MDKFIKQNLLLISVFITGACVLIIEVVAVRILSPHYGNTIFTVSSVISIILTALSVGYYVGGELADKYASLLYFFWIILVSGLVVLIIHFLGLLILPILSVTLSITSGPLISSLFLFFIPAFLLGTLSPLAIKLQSVYMLERGIGSVSGKIFFWSTFGSIIGSLLAGFILIPNFGIDSIFITTGAVLALLGFIPLIGFIFDKKLLIKFVLVFLILVGVTIFAVHQTKGDSLYTKDGIYERITIRDIIREGRPVRIFKQDRSSSGAMFLDTDDSTDLVYEYTKYYSLYTIFKPDIKNALVIGGGAYSIPKALITDLPNATIDVAEIEPSLFDLAKQYFNVKDNPNLNNYIKDGRRLLQDSSKKYDLIFVDAYSSLYSIPAHFTTREFFTIAKEQLYDGGVIIANIVGDLSRQKHSMIFAEIKTFQSVFPNSYFFAVENPKQTDSQNTIFVGYNSDQRVDLSAVSILQNPNPVISLLRNKIINLNMYNLDSYPILTDNYSPIEYITAKVLQRAFSKKPLLDGKETLAVIDQQLSYASRYIGLSGHEKAQQFLIAAMQEQTNEVITQSWNYKETNGNVHNMMNIIGRLYPARERRIILGAHYNSEKFADLNHTNKNQPVSSANDSASGVAILVELARILSSYDMTPNVGVDIVFFDGEWEGSDHTNWKPLGSTYFAEHLSEIYGNSKPVSALVLDMVCNKNLRIYKEQLSVQNAPAQVELFWNIAKNIDNVVFQDEVRQSIQYDHAPLNQAGIPSLLLVDFEHSPGDTFYKCSVKSLEIIARAVFEYIYSIH